MKTILFRVPTRLVVVGDIFKEGVVVRVGYVDGERTDIEIASSPEWNTKSFRSAYSLCFDFSLESADAETWKNLEKVLDTPLTEEQRKKMLDMRTPVDGKCTCAMSTIMATGCKCGGK